MSQNTQASHYPVENIQWIGGLNGLELRWAPISKEENKQKHEAEAVSEMGSGMETKDSSPEEQTESL